MLSTMAEVHKCPRLRVQDFVLLGEAPSQLCRSQCLQVNTSTHFAASFKFFAPFCTAHPPNARFVEVCIILRLAVNFPAFVFQVLHDSKKPVTSILCAKMFTKVCHTCGKIQIISRGQWFSQKNRQHAKCFRIVAKFDVGGSGKSHRYCIVSVSGGTE